MKAMVKEKAEPGLWMRDVPIPETSANDVLIKSESPQFAAPTFISGTGTSSAPTTSPSRWSSGDAADDCDAASGLNVSGLITHRLSIDDFAAMISGDSGKVVMDW